MIGFRHHDRCNCGCRHVIGLAGVVIEQVTIPGYEYVILRFEVPSLTGGPAREHVVAYSTAEYEAAS